MKAHHYIKNLRFSDEYMVLIIDEAEKKFRIQEISAKLERATQAQRDAFVISPSGYGIHWPLIDEDLSIDGLLGIVHPRESRRKIA